MAKRYGQHCPVAKSLDLVGERWTLLIVRDLLRAPARFQDLRAQLAGIPPKLLADRLRRLERQGPVTRGRKRPPFPSTPLARSYAPSCAPPPDSRPSVPSSPAFRRSCLPTACGAWSVRAW